MVINMPQSQKIMPVIREQTNRALNVSQQMVQVLVVML
jgi:hypothetical protein